MAASTPVLPDQAGTALAPLVGRPLFQGILALQGSARRRPASPGGTSPGLSLDNRPSSWCAPRLPPGRRGATRGIANGAEAAMSETVVGHRSARDCAAALRRPGTALAELRIQRYTVGRSSLHGSTFPT